MIFDDQQVLVLFEKSIDKTLAHSLETTATGMLSNGEDTEIG